MIESRWWNSSVAADFRKKAEKLSVGGSQLREREYEFVKQINQLIRANDDLMEIGVQEWVPSSKQINYIHALYREYCTEPLER